MNAIECKFITEMLLNILKLFLGLDLFFIFK